MQFRPRSGFLLVPLAGLVSSCGGNALHYEPSSHALTTCSGAVLTNVFVKATDGKDFYHLKKRPGSAGTVRLRLDQLGGNYVVSGWDGRVRLAGVRLRPNTSYRISNASDGDAASSDVLVKTDADGLIQEGSPTACR